MPQCKRCTKRLTYQVKELNNGYCDICLILIGREIVNSDGFDYSVQDRVWLENAKHNLSRLYVDLKTAGMANPLRGFDPKMTSLFYSIFNADELNKIYQECEMLQ